MRTVNQPDYLIWLRKPGWLPDDFAWLAAGIEPASVPDEDREIVVQPRDRFIRETRGMWKRPQSSQLPDHLQKAFDTATSIKRLMLDDTESGKPLAGALTLQDTPRLQRALPPQQWLRWAGSRGIKLPDALRDAVETPEQKNMRLAKRKRELIDQHGKKFNFNETMAAEEDVSVARIKQRVKKGEKLLLEQLTESTTKRRK